MTARARGVAAALIWTMCTWPSPAAADPPAAPGQFQGQPIAAIDLLGPTAPDRATFEHVSRVQPGRAYSAAAIRRAIEQLAKSGDWSDIRVSAEARDAGVDLTFAFVPRVRISRVQFQGHHHQPTRALKAAAGLNAGDELSDSAIAAAQAGLRAWYDRSGYIVDLSAKVALEEFDTRARVTFGIRERDRLRLRSITFPGTPAFSKVRHLVALRTARGEYVSRDHIERGVDRLRDLYREAGYLTASIGPVEWSSTPKGIILAVPIQQGTRYRVEIVGETGVTKSTLTDQMTLFEDPRDDETALADEAERLARFLADRGYRRAAVRLERAVDDVGTVVIRVVVDAGPSFPLRDVVITGNIAAPDAELQALLATTPGGWRNRYAHQNELDGDRLKILSWYRSHGFLSPNVDVRIEEAENPPAVMAVFAVEEGPQTRIGRVVVEGQGAVPLQPILERHDLREGSPYVEVRLRAARTSLLEAYNELGYVYATVDVAPAVSPDHTRADVRITIVEGPAVKVGQITLSGNTRTKDHVILRELTLRPGDPFNPQRIFENQRRVAQLGFLREVRLEPTSERQEPVKDLRLSVRERDAGMVDLGVGYSNYEGMRGFAEITYRNLLGLGRRAGLRLEGSRIERKTILSYRHPWLFERRIDGKAALFHEVREEETRNYQRSTYGTSVGVDRTLRPRLFGSLVYDYQINDFEALDPNTPQDLLPFDEDRSNIGSLTPSLIWNTRDDLFNPRSGTLATVAFESAALLLGSREQFWKVTAGASRFIPLSKPLVLAVGTRAGLASRFGETREALIQDAPTGTDVRIPLLLPPNERFYVGGRSSIRGYEEDTVGPKLDDGTPTGGNVFLVLNAELRVTVVGSLGVVAFWDGGNTWLDPDDIRWTDIKTTVGLGLRYNTPVGPLRLDYGFKLNREPRPPDPDGAGPQPQPEQEAAGAFHFTLGHAF